MGTPDVTLGGLRQTLNLLALGLELAAAVLTKKIDLLASQHFPGYPENILLLIGKMMVNLVVQCLRGIKPFRAGGRRDLQRFNQLVDLMVFGKAVAGRLLSQVMRDQKYEKTAFLCGGEGSQFCPQLRKWRLPFIAVKAIG